MLKKRIIPLLLWKEGRLVKTISFRTPRIVGEPVRTCKVYSDQDADEIIIVNIDQMDDSQERFVLTLKKISSEVMMPITVGGGICKLDDARILFDAGADKVLINSAGYSSPELFGDIAGVFGSQAVVAGVDFLRVSKQKVLYSHCGSRSEKIPFSDHLKLAEESGSGEIMIQSIGRDGTKLGLDLEAISEALGATTVPVVVAGGVGDFTHIRDAFDLGAAGVACGTLFNFGDNNPMRAKAYLRNYGIPLKIAS